VFDETVTAAFDGSTGMRAKYVVSVAFFRGPAIGCVRSNVSVEMSPSVAFSGRKRGIAASFSGSLGLGGLGVCSPTGTTKSAAMAIYIRFIYTTGFRYNWSEMRCQPCS